MFPNEALIHGSFDIFSRREFAALQKFLSKKLVPEPYMVQIWSSFSIWKNDKCETNSQRFTAYDCEICSQVLQSNKVIFMFPQYSEPSLFAYAHVYAV